MASNGKHASGARGISSLAHNTLIKDRLEGMSERGFPILLAGDANAGRLDWKLIPAASIGSIYRNHANRVSCLIIGLHKPTIIPQLRNEIATSLISKS